MEHLCHSHLCIERRAAMLALVFCISSLPYLPDWAWTRQCARSCADHPAPRIGTRHKKRKGAAALKGPERQAQGLADLADMASMFTGTSLPLLGPQGMRYTASCFGAASYACELARVHLSVACSIMSLCCLNDVHVCRARQQAS